MAYDITYVHSDTAAATTLNTGVSNADTSLTLVDAGGYPSPSGSQRAVLILDPKTSSEEKIYYTARSGNTLTGVARGQFGTSATSHESGSGVIHGLTASEASEYRDAMLQTIGKVLAAGDLLVGSGANVMSRLAKGTNGYLLATESGALAWASLATLGIQPSDPDLATIAAAANTSYGLALLTLANQAAFAALSPLGTVGYAAVTANQGPIGSTVTSLTSLTVTFTALAGRRYKITGSVNASVNTAGFSPSLIIADGSNTVINQAALPPVEASNQAAGLHVLAVVVPGAGSVTYKLRMASGDPSATTTLVASATQPSFLLAEDIGV